jgi:2-C-methyl-D-erythritol 4-phosphate cytidylyltransferase/2-C-methyl-D-erythritol 2,4-cyclodiphosphate synthase
MRTEMARIMEIEIDRMSVKATTSERLGFTGRGEGIACIATCTLLKT